MVMITMVTIDKAHCLCERNRLAMGYEVANKTVTSKVGDSMRGLANMLFRKNYSVVIGAIAVAISGSLYAEESYNPARFETTTLVSGMMRPMELAIAKDGRIFYIELTGQVKVLDPKSKQVDLIGELPVTIEQENGLIGLALDPNFAETQWIYLQYSPPNFSGQHVSRFTLVDGKIDLKSEKVLLTYEEQRKECCHHAGSLAFGPGGELFIGTGDNTNPFGDSQGYAPIDERPEKWPFDAQRSSANTKSYNGKVLRIRPLPDGTYEIPDGNLFPKDGSVGLPEIYVMGCRNPWRVSVDPKTGYLYWGDVGPDAGGDGPRGPRGYDELNQARKAGFFGWPLFIGNNQAYPRVNFATGEIGEKFDAAKPVNLSVNNTGAKELPPAQPAFIYYPAGRTDVFPEVGEGGRTACAGPVYDFVADHSSLTRFPEHFHRTLFFYEWSRHWIIAVHLDENSNIKSMERFLPQQRFMRPIDMEFGPDGALYVIEYGETWGVNTDAKLIRIDYVRGNRTPLARAASENNIGRAPLAVKFSSNGTSDKDADELSYRWYATQAGVEGAKRVLLSQEANPTVTFDANGTYNVELVVTDPSGASNVATLPVLVGNEKPRIRFLEPLAGSFYDPDKPVDFKVYVRDFEDGTSDFEEADKESLESLDSDAPQRVNVNAMIVQTPPGRAASANDLESGPPGLRLMKNSDCFNCHSVDQPRVGPRFLDVAQKYRNQPEALEASVQRVIKGSTGVWGKVAMLPHDHHSPEEIRQMVQWVFAVEPDQAVRAFKGFAGSIDLQSKPNASPGYMVLDAIYTDLGTDSVPPQSETVQIVLRPRLVEAEHAEEIGGSRILDSGSAHGGKFIGAIDHGHHLKFKDVPLDQVTKVKLRVASAGAGGEIELRSGSKEGKLLVSVPIEVNGQWEGWYEKEVALPAGMERGDLVVVFVNKNKASGLMNLDSLRFEK